MVVEEVLALDAASLGEAQQLALGADETAIEAVVLALLQLLIERRDFVEIGKDAGLQLGFHRGERDRRLLAVALFALAAELGVFGLGLRLGTRCDIGAVGARLLLCGFLALEGVVAVGGV